MVFNGTSANTMGGSPGVNGKVICLCSLLLMSTVHPMKLHTNGEDVNTAKILIKIMACQSRPPAVIKFFDTSGQLTRSFPFWHLHIPVKILSTVVTRELPRRRKALRSLTVTKKLSVQYSVHVIFAVESTLPKLRAYLMTEKDYESPQRDRFFLTGGHSAVSQVMSSELATAFKYIFALSDEFPRHEYCGQPFMNLKGKTINALAGKVPTYFQVNYEGSVSGGSHYIMFTSIAHAYNFTANVTTKRVGTGVLKNGTWNGMTGAVYYREYDVGLLQSATYERSGIMDFVFVQFSTVLFTTKCAGREVVSGNILAPFQTEVWTGFAVSFFAVAVATYLILWHYHNARDSVVFTVFIPFQIALDQGFDIQIPRGLKTMSAIWMFSMVIINTGYRSDLVKYFSFPKYEILPEDLQQLDSMKNYTVIFNYNGGTAYNYFIGANGGILKRIRERSSLEPNMEKCVVASALNQKTVCISWDLNVRPIIGKNLTLPGSFEPCVVFSKPILTFSSGVTLTRNSIYTDAFVRAVGQVRDSGLIEKWNQGVVYNFSMVGKTWYRESPGDMHQRILILNVWEAHHEQSPFLKLTNISTAFELLIACLMTAVVTFAAETFCHKVRHRFSREFQNYREAEDQEFHAKAGSHCVMRVKFAISWCNQ